MSMFGFCLFNLQRMVKNLLFYRIKAGFYEQAEELMIKIQTAHYCTDQNILYILKIRRNAQLDWLI